MDILERLADTELNTSSDLFHLRKDAIAEINRLNADIKVKARLLTAQSVEINRLRAIVRVNGLRWGHTHAEIDAILDAKD